VRNRKRTGDWARTFALAWLLSSAAACSAVVDPDVGRLGGPPPPTCTPRTVVDCACAGGFNGKQVCNEGGTFNPCSCGTAGSAGTGGSRAGSGGSSTSTAGNRGQGNGR
jgi:hypothetical protein